MQSKFSIIQWVLASMLLTSVASAQTARVVTPADVDCNCGESLNRFSVSYRMGLNISARFKNIGGYVSQNSPGPASSGTNHYYDDGYNLLDVSDNFEHLTWNWGYQNASQLPGDDTIVMSSSSSAANGRTKREREDPQHGFEFTYRRALGQTGKCQWGIEAAFGFMDVSISDNSRLSGTATRISDSYALGGTIPPLAPYSGTFNGPGPLISDIPIRTMTTVPGGAVATGRRQLDAEIYGLRLGPYVRIPATDRLSISLSGGFALLSVNSDFRFRETVTVSGNAQTRNGGGSKSELLPGAYVSGNLEYAVRDNVDLFAGLQYQAAGTFSHKEDRKEAVLDLGESLFLVFGIGFSF